MVAFIDAYRQVHGVESICTLLPIAPSTYFRHKAQQMDPTTRSTRAQRDDELRAIICRIWTENHQVYGPRKVWRQMGRDGLRVARCRVRRLMREMGLAGDGGDRGPLRRVLGAVFSDHPHRALSYLGGISTRSCHRLHPLNEWALRQSRYDSGSWNARVE